MNNKIKRIPLVGIMCALAAVLSFFESLLPALPAMPPGAKLGLSNIVTMVAARDMGLPVTLLIAVVKSLFVLLTRGATAFFMSLSGGILSSLCMWLLFRLRRFHPSYLVIAVCGALCHNFGQLLISLFYIGAGIFYYLPMLCIFSIVFGSLTGIICSKMPDKYTLIKNH